MSKMTELISASKAYNLAHLEGKAKLYHDIETAAKCGDMFYDAVTASLTDDTIDELKAAGYEISPMISHTRISWKNVNNAFNQ